jgi:predicted metalloprotease with PDZ domain
MWPLLISIARRAGQQMIHYHLIAIDPKAHLFRVEMTLDAPMASQKFWLPSWIPGSYMVRDFARNIIDLKVTDEHGAVLPLEQTDKQTWRVENNARRLQLSYLIYAWDLSVRSAHLDATHGFFNASSVFLAAKGAEHLPHAVTIARPEDPEFSHWRLATTLPPSQERPAGSEFDFGDFIAADYDELIDHPVEMGDFSLASFEACGVRHDVVLTGRHKADMARLCKDLKAICEYQIRLFGSPAPFERYLFLTTVLDNGFGGLEHRASTALMCSRKDLPTSMTAQIHKEYRTYLSLCSHEYFHSWNVKRIKPESFIPYQLEGESYTEQLWAFEGLTSYYDDFLTFRAGLVDESAYLDMLSETFTRVYRGKGRMLQSLKESSFNAWTKFYKQDENAQNAIVSYYTKGALFGLLLDLTLRLETQGRYSLDHVMRALWQEYGLKGIGTSDDSHQVIVERLLGRDCSELFAYLDNTQDLPLPAMLAQFGVEFILRQSSGNQDVGGGNAQGLAIGFGAKTKSEPLGLRIVSVNNGSPAHLAGLSAGDLLIAADNLMVTGQFEQLLQQYTQGDSIELHWFRRDELMTGKLPIMSAEADTVSLKLIDSDAAARWLGR